MGNEYELRLRAVELAGVGWKTTPVAEELAWFALGSLESLESGKMRVTSP